MTEIPVERKSSHAWIWILLALIVLGLIIWWIAAEDDDDAEYVDNDVETAMIEDADTASTATEGLIAQIAASPEAFIGRDGIAADVTVDEVPTDRGFWISQDDARMFALIVDTPREIPKDINPGQQLQISGAMVRDADDTSDVRGRPLDDDTSSILAEQQAYLLVPEENITINPGA